MNGYGDARTYTIEQLRAYFETYHTTGKHGRTRVDRCERDGCAAHVQTEDGRLRFELQGAGFQTTDEATDSREFYVETLDSPLPVEFERTDDTEPPESETGVSE